MKKPFKILLATAVTALFAVGCAKEYDDSAINQKIDGLDARVSKLEAAVQELNNTTIPGLKNLITALQNQVSIKTVTALPTGGYEILFSDGTKATIKDGVKGDKGDKGDQGEKGDKGDKGDQGDKGDKGDKGDQGANGQDGKDGKDGANGQDGKDGQDGADGKDGETPVIGVQLVDGVYCWTVNGVLLKDADGKPIPVTGKDGKDGKDGQDGKDGKDGKDGAAGAGAIAPQFRYNDGQLEYSVDEGKTWQAVPEVGEAPAPAIVITETDDAWTFTLADNTSFSIPKVKAFAIEITVEPGAKIFNQQKMSIPYTIVGVEEGDELSMDVLNIVPNYSNFSYEIVPADEDDLSAGIIELTYNSWEDDVLYKVFVYAANGKGKTDIKCIAVTVKSFEAVFDTELVAAEGGEFAFDVESNDPFDVVTDVDWIEAVKTKAANYEWHGTVNVAKNETNWYRSGHVQVYQFGGIMKEFEILQDPGAEIATNISRIKNNNTTPKGKEGIIANHLTVVAAGKSTAVVTDGFNLKNTNSYLILKNVNKALEVGKVYDFVGTKDIVEAWGNEGILTDVSATLVEEAEPVEFEFMSRYYYNSVGKFSTTIIYGEVAKEVSNYSIESGFPNLAYSIEDAAEFLKLDELVGKIVYMKAIRLGYESVYDEVNGWNEFTSHIIPLEIEAVEFSDETSVEYDFDEYYRSKVIIPEGLYARVVLENTQELVEAEQDYKDYIAYYARRILQNISANVSPEYFVKNSGWFSTDTYYLQWLDDMDWDDNKTWIVVEIGENCLPNGKYLQEEFVRKPVPYEEYLGSWNVGNYNFVISEKEAGKTFNIKGINNTVISPYNPSGEVILIEAEYDAEIGQMSVASQEIAPPYEYSSRTFVDFLAANNTEYDAVGTVLMNGNVKKDWEDRFYLYSSRPDDTNYEYLRFKVQDIVNGYRYTTFGANNMYLYGEWYYKDVEQDPSEKYEAWLGEWMLGEQKLTISKDVANKSVVISGLVEEPEVNVVANFNEETGTLTFVHSKTGASVKKDGRYFEYYSVGQDDKDEFVWGADENQSVATLAIQEDGTVKVEAASVTHWENYYEHNGFDQWPYDWGILGTFWGTDWNYFANWCKSDGEWYVLEAMWLEPGNEFKFCKNNEWAQGDFGGTFTQLDKEFDLVEGGDNIVFTGTTTGGEYDILFNPTTKKAKIVEAEGQIEIHELIPTAKFGVAPYNAAMGWDKDKAVMFDISATLSPVKESEAAAMKAARAKKSARPASTPVSHKDLNLVELVIE